MKFAKWAMKLSVLVLIICTFSWVGLVIYSLVVDDKDNIALNLLLDVIRPIDRALSSIA
jgi:hypothetical protein